VRGVWLKCNMQRSTGSDAYVCRVGQRPYIAHVTMYRCVERHPAADHRYSQQPRSCLRSLPPIPTPRDRQAFRHEPRACQCIWTSDESPARAGLDESKQRLLFYASGLEARRDVKIPLNVLRQCGKVTVTIQLRALFCLICSFAEGSRMCSFCCTPGNRLGLAVYSVVVT